MAGNIEEDGQWKNRRQGDDRRSNAYRTKAESQFEQDMVQLLEPMHLGGSPGRSLRKMREGERV